MILKIHRSAIVQYFSILSGGIRSTNRPNEARSPLHTTVMTVGFLLGFIPTVVIGKSTDDDLAELKKMLLQQQSIIQEQDKRLRKQEELLRQLIEQRSAQPLAGSASDLALPTATSGAQASITSDSSIVSKASADGRLTKTPSLEQPASPAKTSPTIIATPPSAKTAEKSQLAATPKGLSSPEPERDSVGDLNVEGVRAGTFPGSIKIPGPYDVSVAIGGFAKTALIVSRSQAPSCLRHLEERVGYFDGWTDLDYLHGYQNTARRSHRTDGLRRDFPASAAVALVSGLGSQNLGRSRD